MAKYSAIKPTVAWINYICANLGFFPIYVCAGTSGIRMRNIYKGILIARYNCAPWLSVTYCGFEALSSGEKN